MEAILPESGHGEDTGSQARFICSANFSFAPYAQEELRRLFGSLKSTMLVPGEIFLVTLPAESADVVQRLQEQPVMFLRHLFPVQYQEPVEDAESALEQLTKYVLAQHKKLQGRRISVQVRKTKDSSYWAESAGALKQAITDRLSELQAEFTVREADYILSVLADGPVWYAGLSEPADNLSDWNGGAIRFQKEEGQVSRAKFKLLEAAEQFSINFTAYRNALDIGAAPGGWTSFLLERGVKVTAVDPAKMDPTVMNMPNLTYLRKNAGEVRFREQQFDLLVCDMSWSPKQMAKLVTNLLYSLVSGGTAVVTVKLMHKKPLALIQDVITTFEDAGMQVQRAKQLFHNRDEITLYMIKYL